MNLIYTTYTDQFHPVSFTDNYLYENYQRVVAFLKTRIKSDEFRSFAKPVLVDNRIDWYADAHGTMISIVEHSAEHQKKVEESYVSLRRKIHQIIHQLKSQTDQENVVWANLLETIFNTEDNLLVSNGNDWALIWGWKFRNTLHYVTPNFFEEPDDNPVNKESEIIPTIIDTVPTAPQEELKEDIPEDELKFAAPAEVKIKPKLSFWERIKRFLRWITYRFWGLMLMILFVLLVCCLCRKCSSSKEKCPNSIEKELDRLDQRVKDRCFDHKHSE